jgi:hypothetical protein
VAEFIVLVLLFFFFLPSTSSMRKYLALPAIGFSQNALSLGTSISSISPLPSVLGHGFKACMVN